MSAAGKKRKLKHLTDNALAAAASLGKQERGGKVPHTSDPRFQLDSDFSDSDEGEKGFNSAAGPGPTSEKASGARKQREVPRRQAEGTIKPEEPNRTPASGEEGNVDDVDDDESADLGADGTSDEDDEGAADLSASRKVARRAEGSGPGKASAQAASADNGANAGPSEGPLADVAQQDEGVLQRPGDGKRKKVLSKRKLEQVKEASDRRGIVYISRIPPHMKPKKLRRLLEPFGEIGRVYCAAEDAALRRMRKKKGGNAGKNFTEGWVEFEDKRRAKRAALALNGQPMGGSKRSSHYYDLWCIKYLPKFKWDALTEEINYQRAVREQRLVAEISAAKRERDFYLSRVDKAKAVSAIQERRSKKEQQQQGEGTGREASAAAAAPTGSIGPRQGPSVAAADRGGEAQAAAAAAAQRPGGKLLERHFGQRRVKADPVSDDRAPVLAGDVLGLLGGKRGRQAERA